MKKMMVSWTVEHDGILGMGGKDDDTFKFDIPDGYQFAGFDAKVLAGRHRPGVRVTKQPGHGTTGDGQRAKVHWWFDGGSSPFIKYKATATYIDGAIEKEQRALLVACDLVDEGLSPAVPTGASLGQAIIPGSAIGSSYEWETATFSTPISLDSASKYALGIGAPDGGASDYIQASGNTQAGGGLYPGGYVIISDSGGATWEQFVGGHSDLLFQVISGSAAD